jgi:translocation and assembly module TamB
VAIFDRQSGASESRSPQSPARRRFTGVLKFLTAFVIFPVLLGAIIAAFLLNSAAGHSYLLNLIQSEAAKSLGVGVHLQNFTLHLSTVSADVYGLTVDSAGPNRYPPLLQVDHGHVAVRVVSVFGRKWYFDSIRIDHPVARIYVDKNGVSNLPTFKSNSNSNTSVFDLGIRHAVLTNGAVFYNDQPRAVTLDLRNVEFDSTFNNLQKKYSGTLAYADGRINYAGTDVPSHTLNLRFDATPDMFRLSPAKIASGNTQFTLTATLNNYSAPSIEAQYSATLDGQQLAGILHQTSIPSGLVSLSGSAQYQSDPHRTFLQCLAVNGDLSSHQLVSSTPSLRAEVSNLIAHYSLANGDATVRDLRASLLGGEVTAHGSTTKIGENDSHTRLDAALHGISLADAKGMMGSSALTGPVAISGRLNATANAEWGKTLDDLVAHTDATISAAAANPHQQQAMLSPASLQEPTNAAPPTGPVPIQGTLHATYTAADKKLSVNDSHIHTPQTNLDLNGTVGDRSSLSVHLRANDLREVDSIAELFRTAAPGKPVQPLGLSGTANFNGVVTGSTSAPHLTGQFAAQNLQVQGSTWKEIRTSVDASPSQVSLQHAELIPANQGHISMNASAQLRKWSFSNNSPIRVQLNASQIDIAELVRLSGTQAPVTGTMAANISMHGSVLRPEGNGNITVTKAAAYGEPITSAKVTFTGGGDQAHANLAIVSPAGSISGVVATNPNQKTFSAELTSNGIHLDQLQNFKGNSANPSGVVTISAKGQGTFDNPQVDATLQIPKFVVQQQAITDIRLHANLANHVANAQLTSNALNAAIKANARVTLTGNYPADATLDTQGIPLGPLLATYAPDQADSLSGQTEVHATLHGPLKNMRQIEAHATIPVLKVSYSNTVQLAAAAPIHVDYKDGMINVQRSSIRGTDTDLQFQGNIPTTGNAPMSLLLLGSIDMHLVQLFDPDLRTSGQLKFNVNSYGAAHGPDVAGTIDLVDASMASPDMPVGLQHCNGTFSITKDRINISQFKGNVGGGTITAQGGVALRPAIQFDMGVAARDVRMLYPQGMREAVNANLRFTGTPKAAQLGGNVNLTELSFTRAFDMNNFINELTGGVEAPPSRGFTQDIALNIAVHSTNNVNLVSRTLSVGGSANLQVRGTASEPVILGRINLTGGDVIFNGNRFVLTGGTIQFVNPSVTQPVVNLTITTSIQQYNISLRFDGPVDQLRTQYTSDPALPSADIIHLLAFGSTTETASAPAGQAAESLVANQVSSQVTSRVSKAAGISQLSINPVLGGSGQQNTGANITIQQRVTGNLFITFSTNTSTTQGQTVQGEYHVSPRLSFSATRDPNGGFAVDTQIKKTW